VLHGDAHQGNLLAAANRGWLWIDLEETGRGPAAWDLATMVSHYPEREARSALAAYAAESGTAVPALAPFRRVRDLEAAVWSACMAHLYPARYAEPAHRLLASVLSE
jgi:Ser/Thr protein kinase RdoA (MazF antagonist)